MYCVGRQNWQKIYGVDGFSFYHYRFKDDHKVLYKPAELLLENKDIDIEYHFTWANHDWIKKIKNESKSEKTLLVDYGGKQQWKTHYDYLSQFFHDERYSKVNGKPLFIIYHYQDVREKAKGMLRYWDELAVQDGFPGLCFVAMDSNRTKESRKEIFSDPMVSYSLDFVPGRVRDELRKKDWIRVGKGGIIARHDNPAKFQECLEKILEHSLVEGQEYVYLTAWNEWGETNRLEPDSIYGYGWLKAVREARKKVGV